MKKLKATITSLATLTALSLVGAAVVYAQKSAPITVKADTPNVQLISPQSYQQYLPLATPTAVSVTSGFTAIADGKTIYIYEGDVNPSQDSETGAYRTYTHANAINQLAFDEKNISLIKDIVEVYRAKIIDLTSSNMVVELTGKPSKIDGFLQVMAPYHVLEMCRSGIIGMPRGSQSDWWKAAN